MSLTSIVSYQDRNNKYGKNHYRGNCSGQLIKDLLEFYKPKRVFDPIVGSGTTEDVCKELGIKHLCLDLNPDKGGFDALADDIPQSSDFIFWHPPYYNIIKYSGNMWGKPDSRDLSRCETYKDFIRKINKIESKLITSLRKKRQIGNTCRRHKEKRYFIQHPKRYGLVWKPRAGCYQSAI